MIKLAPSILSADFANLGAEITLVDSSPADYIHVDIMDGVFVPASSFGAPVVKAIRKYTSKPFDVHLMVQDPDSYVPSMIEAGADIITVHVEASKHLHRSIQLIKGFGKKAGVVLNPSTPLQVLDYVLEDLEMVLLMSVNPGFGGQAYIEAVTRKIEELRRTIDGRGLDTEIEVDGGIKLDNVIKVVSAGANVIVAGSAVFGKETIQNIERFYSIFREHTK